ncbi:MFS transporter [Paenibacillus sp. LHD-117]|uniref:MFS transporter n=1 Tax=Paenibacillus sp. LHD-117 TaxID=3071412 RepID=UPI0027E213DD|nr:MFS transporter [Paenibacillus sp. LHD-117]MDQ6422228.1 MFS transporter [Paenibacillus sp. LHD-117]
MKKLLWIGCLSYLVIGIAHVVGGSILEQLIDYYGVTYKDGGQWIMNQFLGFMVGVLLAPTLTSRIGKRGAVLLAMGLLTVSEAAYSLLLPWGWMLAFAPLAGIGFGMTEAIVGAAVIDLMKGKASAMSRLETFFGIGALIIPVTAAYLIGQHVWQLSFPILAAMAGITFVLWLTMSFGELDGQLGMTVKRSDADADREGVIGISGSVGSPVDVEQSNARTLGKRGGRGLLGYSGQMLPFLALSALFFLIYVGMEMSFSNYLPSILITRSGMGEAGAAASLSLFWGTVVLGRLFAGIIADRIGYAKYLTIATIGAAAVFGMMTLFGGTFWMLALIALSGLCFSGIFGIALVYANGLLPGMTERTTSLLVAFGGIGGALFPRITGWLMDRYDVELTVGYLASLVVVMLLLLGAMLMQGRRLLKLSPPAQTEPR